MVGYKAKYRYRKWMEGRHELSVLSFDGPDSLKLRTTQKMLAFLMHYTQLICELQQSSKLLQFISCEHKNNEAVSTAFFTCSAQNVRL